MKILMGVDLEYSGETVRALVAQCRPESTEVMVLHVLQPMGTAPPQMDAYFAPELEAEKVAADELVGRAAKELQDAGFQAHSRAIYTSYWRSCCRRRPPPRRANCIKQWRGNWHLIRVKDWGCEP